MDKRMMMAWLQGQAQKQELTTTKMQQKRLGIFEQTGVPDSEKPSWIRGIHGFEPLLPTSSEPAPSEPAPRDPDEEPPPSEPAPSEPAPTWGGPWEYPPYEEPPPSELAPRYAKQTGRWAGPQPDKPVYDAEGDFVGTRSQRKMQQKRLGIKEAVNYGDINFRVPVDKDTGEPLYDLKTRRSPEAQSNLRRRLENLYRVAADTKEGDRSYPATKRTRASEMLVAKGVAQAGGSLDVKGAAEVGKPLYAGMVTRAEREAANASQIADSLKLRQWKDIQQRRTANRIGGKHLLPGALGAVGALLPLAFGASPAEAGEAAVHGLHPLSMFGDTPAGLGSDQVDHDYDKYYDKEGRPRRSAWPADTTDVQGNPPNWSPEINEQKKNSLDLLLEYVMKGTLTHDEHGNPLSAKRAEQRAHRLAQILQIASESAGKGAGRPDEGREPHDKYESLAFTHNDQLERAIASLKAKGVIGVHNESDLYDLFRRSHEMVRRGVEPLIVKRLLAQGEWPPRWRSKTAAEVEAHRKTQALEFASTHGPDLRQNYFVQQPAPSVIQQNADEEQKSLSLKKRTDARDHKAAKEREEAYWNAIGEKNQKEEEKRQRERNKLIMISGGYGGGYGGGGGGGGGGHVGMRTGIR